MAIKNLGFHWGAWTTLVDGVQVNSGGNSTSDAVDLADKSACEVSVVAVYSNHAFVSGGTVSVLRQIESGTPTYEAASDGPSVQVQLNYVQNGTRNRVFSLDPRQMGNFKLYLDCPTLSGASITYTIRYRTATLRMQ